MCQVWQGLFVAGSSGEISQRRGYGIARERGLLKKNRLKTPDFQNIVLYEISRLSCTFERFSFQVFAFLFH